MNSSTLRNGDVEASDGPKGSRYDTANKESTPTEFVRKTIRPQNRKRRERSSSDSDDIFGATTIICNGESSTEQAVVGSKQFCAFVHKPRRLNTSSSKKSKTNAPPSDAQSLEGQVMDGESADLLIPRYAAAKTVRDTDDQKATARFQVDSEIGQDHRSILERNMQIGQDILAGKLEKGIYRGAGAYAPVVNVSKDAVAAGKYTGRYGPVRGTDNVRMTLRIDYDPSICKDYHETGYCGFGATCKFLHDRTDYKSGWQMEKEWETEQKKKQKRLEAYVRKQNGGESDALKDSDESSSDESGEDEDSLPFACLCCKEKWNSHSRPVVTVCSHYFCEKCALDCYKKSTKCSKCGTETGGLFNEASKITRKVPLD